MNQIRNEINKSSIFIDRYYVKAIWISITTYFLHNLIFVYIKLVNDLSGFS